MKFIRAFIDANIRLCKACDKVIALDSWRRDGNDDFINNVVPTYVTPSLKIYDVGGGKTPAIGADEKTAKNLTITGVDIDADELARAPTGLYDATIAADIGMMRGAGDGDLAICRALMEHVEDTDAALAGIASLLKPGGKALVFAPSRNAIFARLNLILPEEVKKKILFTIFPKTAYAQGFKAYYDRCTPRDFKRMAVKHNLRVVEKRAYYMSNYFFCFFPAYIIWRLWQTLFYIAQGPQAAETFVMVFEKT